jgi:hypothetical protein
VALLSVAALAAPSAANAAEPVATATGQILQVVAPTSGGLAVAGLDGATAANDGSQSTATSTTPIPASALRDLSSTQVGATPLLGDNGIVQLGPLGQFSQANSDGSSSAFAGVTSDLPSLLGATAAVPASETYQPPSGNNVVQLNLGNPATDPIAVTVAVDHLAAAAQQAANGQQYGSSSIGNAVFTVGGQLLASAIGQASGAIAQAQTAAPDAGIVDPFAGKSISMTLADLLASAGAGSLGQLPANTDLLSLLPNAITAQFLQQSQQANALVDGILDAVNSGVSRIPIGGIFANQGLTIAKQSVDAGFAVAQSKMVSATTIATALSALAQVKPNVQTIAVNGAFTQTALQVTYLPGSVSAVQFNLANATVCAIVTVHAVPIANLTTVALAGLALLVIAGVLVRHRRRAGAIAAS